MTRIEDITLKGPEGMETGGTRCPTLEALPLSLLNDLLYCLRRAALKAVEGWRAANEHTVRGGILHEHADLAGDEVAKGVTLLRALPVWSDRLGLSGKCDVVEARPHPQPLSHPMGKGGGYESLAPVEYKKGKRSEEHTSESSHLGISYAVFC